MKDEVIKRSKINIEVGLNNDKQPVEINWQADDAGIDRSQVCKSIMLAFWDEKAQSSLRIDLWTNDMMVPEMQRFFYETLNSMSDTYRRATGDDDLADEMKKFSEEFGKKANAL
ncbi:MAG: gliding motility protein GldC [Bacteroidia bacterium]|nr:gliding motility protein GldC [Bacteroidia bacterium]